MKNPWMASLLLLTTACLVGEVSFVGKHCTAPGDCPTGLVCDASSASCVAPGLAGAEVGPGGTTGEDGGAGTDGGLNPVDPNNSTGPFYCTDVKPILDQHCISCHTSPPAGNAPSSFRLDYYAPETSGGLPGAFAKALRIAARVTLTSGQMPPSGPIPAEQRRVILDWIDAGAPECAGLATPDGGIPVKTVPEVVSFALDVQPIFNDLCVSCHSGSAAEANLDLSQGRAWAALVGSGQGADSEECGSGAVRVSPGDTGSSVLFEVLAAESGCAPTMPLDSDGLKNTSPVDFQIIEKWIAQGARNN